MFKTTMMLKISAMSTNQQQKPKNNKNIKGDKKSISLAISAFISAVLATSCCLPALCFLLFGSSFGALSFFEPLSKYRWILSLIAGIFFLAFIYYKFIKRCTQNCCVKKTSLKAKLGIFLTFLIFMFILFYPEILGFIMEKFYA
ncbi:aryl sulfotransferase [Campylobacter ureolyticus]|nr:aryl sulfotransferase [Campylobacter ureolyticus]MDU7070521.1 aryl sulfotransferase [Campylobacter ureolyticus]